MTGIAATMPNVIAIKRQRRQHRQVDAVAQPAMTLAQVAGAVGLRHEGVEPEQHAHAEDRGREIQDAAQADRADGFGREPADHQRVDDAHEHPAKLGHDDRPGQAQRRQQIAANRIDLRAGGGRHKRANLSRVHLGGAVGGSLGRVGLGRLKSGYSTQKKTANASATPYMIG